MKTIKLVGLGSKRYKVLKTNLEAGILKDFKGIFDLEEVNNIDEMLKYHLASIPAILLDDTVLFENGRDLNSQELTELITQELIKTTTMQNILVPTDFSLTSKGAYVFAQQLAEHIDGKLKLLHVTHPVVDASNPYGTTFTDFTKLAEQRLEQFAEGLPKGGNVAIGVETEVSLGYAATDLVLYSDKEDVDLIVMGTTGESGFLRKAFGSVSTHVAKNAHCPVIFIPNDAEFKGLSNIMFASDNKAIDQVIVRSIAKLLKKFNPYIHMVHVDVEEDADFEVFGFKVDFIENHDHSKVSYRKIELEDASIKHGLKTYQEQHEIDMLVMITQHRGFLEDMFHRSTTKQMILDTKIPIMVLHID